jgi:MFS family permease
MVRLLPLRLAGGDHRQALLCRVNETTAFIFALLAFAAGFAVRPFGAIVFGRLGDMIGRKHTFLITIVIMGLSTASSACCPATPPSAWLRRSS